MYVFVFDFDLTLTLHHSGGCPERGQDLFGAKKTKLYDLLSEIRRKGHHTYINTRGSAIEVERYLRFEFGDIVGENKLIEKIYGANSLYEIAYPYGKTIFYELTKNSENPSTFAWAHRKVDFLREIQKETAGEIIFMDDTKLNISVAKENGFENSFVIREPLEEVIRIVDRFLNNK